MTEYREMIIISNGLLKFQIHQRPRTPPRVPSPKITARSLRECAKWDSPPETQGGSK